MSENHLSTTRFSELPIAEEIQSALKQIGYEFCTPVQALALPKALAGTNLIGKARTGSGKTLAFLIATINRLLQNKPAEQQRKSPARIRALILAPTRELALQIERDAQPLLATTNLSVGLAYGGADYEKQRQNLQRGVDILVGTPGRIIDYFKQHVFSLDEVEVLVLDEADRMLDLGFIKDIRFLLRRMSDVETRLNLLFSATLSYRVIELAYEHLAGPEVVNADQDVVTTDNIEQWAYYPGNDEKIPLLIGLIQKFNPERMMVFVNTKHVADRVARYLIGNDVKAQVLSGDVPQKKRQRLVLDFEKGELPVLVATDVAARGLHIPEVSHVVNFDLPQDPEDYVHRIGRTGRIGHKGVAISFVCETYAFSLPEIETYIKKKIPSEPVSADLLVTPKPPVRSEHHDEGRRGGPPRRGPKPPSGHRPQSGAKPQAGDGEKRRRPRRRRSGKPGGAPQSKSEIEQ